MLSHFSTDCGQAHAFLALALALTVAACGTTPAGQPTLVTGSDVAATDAGADGSPADVAQDATATGSDGGAIADVVDSDAANSDAAGADTTADGDGVGDATAADTEDDGGSGDTSDASEAGGGGVAKGLPCDVDADCAGGARCLAAQHLCVDCLSQADCAAGELCAGNACVVSTICKSDLDCKASGKVCNKAAQACVDCNIDADCAAGTCSQGSCVVATSCKSSKECPQVCDTQAGVCVSCVSADDCPADQSCAAGACVADVCDGPACAGGKAFACLASGGGFAAGASCDDGDVCTEQDACIGGACSNAGVKACDDGNPCTDDACDPKAGCVTFFHKAACDDGDGCTESDVCSTGVCKGVAKVCDDGTNCTSDGCSGGKCVFAPVSGPCSDGDACSKDDACAGGKCVSGVVLACDDDNPCTTDSCDKATGCVFVAKTGPCNDGSDCTTNDVCTGGVCLGKGKQCKDDNPCTDDTCLVGECIFKANSKACNDGDACSTGDACKDKVCSGAKVACDDGNACTSDSCKDGGCSFVANSAACSDGDACTEGDACGNGSCKGKAIVCDDGNACTVDSCTGGKCAFVAAADGASCGAEGACSVCSGGQCKSGDAAGWESFFGGKGSDNFSVALPWKTSSTLLVGDKVVGSVEGWLLEVDSKGVLQWEKTYGEAGTDRLYGAHKDGPASATLVGYRGNSAWLLAVDASGGVVHQRAWIPPNSGHAGLYNVVAMGGGHVVGGYRADVNASTKHGMVARLDAKGDLLWEAFPDGLRSIVGVQAAGDEVLLASSGPGSNGGVDVLVRRIKPGGAQVWQVAIGNAGDDTAENVGHVSGGLLVAGTYGGSTPTALVARVSTAGVVQWALPSGEQVGALRAVAADAGSVLAVGQIKESSTDGLMLSLNLATGKIKATMKAPQSSKWLDELLAVYPVGGGAWVVAGSASVEGQSDDGWVMRVGPDLRIGCQCTTSWDDGKPCTIDSCYLGVGKSQPDTSGVTCSTSDNKPGMCGADGECKGSCGDGKCGTGENIVNCVEDCAAPKTHPCDEAGMCGASKSHPVFGCYCDASCKKADYKDCCTPSGGKSTSCYGSKCASCL